MMEQEGGDDLPPPTEAPALVVRSSDEKAASEDEFESPAAASPASEQPPSLADELAQVGEEETPSEVEPVSMSNQDLVDGSYEIRKDDVAVVEVKEQRGISEVSLDVKEAPPISIHGTEPAATTSGGVQQAKTSVVTPNQSLVGPDFERQSPQYSIAVKVTEPAKKGEGMRSFIVYRVETTHNSPLLGANEGRTTELVVFRRFSDFLTLRNNLLSKFLSQGKIIPPAPDKDAVSTTKVKLSKESDLASDFIQKRRSALEMFINKLVTNASFANDPLVVAFLKNDGDMPRDSASTVSKFIKNTARSFTSYGMIGSIEAEGEDSVLTEALQNIFDVEIQLTKLHVALSEMSVNRDEQRLAFNNLSAQLILLANAEENQSLNNAITKLSDCMRDMSDIFEKMSSNDYYSLEERFKDYLAMISAVKEVAYERASRYREWKANEEKLRAKREQLVKFEVALRQDKAVPMRAEVELAEKRLKESNEAFELITRNLREELHLFNLEEAAQVKQCVQRFIERSLELENEVLTQWNSLRSVMDGIQVTAN